jgi:transcriptional regulator with XRE-family HTH domain
MSLVTADDVGELLRRWRVRRRISQQELASRADVSTRHLSCVETGRSRPSLAMIERLADQLDVPLRHRNALLLAGGFAPRYGARGLDDEQVAPVLAGIRTLLDAHNPFPAMLFDDHWDVLDANDAAYVFLDLCDPSLLEPPVNAVRLSLHPDGLGGRVRNLEAWGTLLHQRVRHRAERTHDVRLKELLAEIETYVDVHPQPGPSADPVIAVEIEAEGFVARMYGVGAQLESATDVTLSELHLETFLPADTATREWLTAKAERRQVTVGPL